MNLRASVNGQLLNEHDLLVPQTEKCGKVRIVLKNRRQFMMSQDPVRRGACVMCLSEASVVAQVVLKQLAEDPDIAEVRSLQLRGFRLA